MEWQWDFPGVFWPFFGVFVILALAILAFDVWMLVDAIQRPSDHFSSSDAKTWWIVGLVVGLVTGLPAIAIAIAYYFVVRKPAGEGRRSAPASSSGYSPPPVPAAGAAPGAAPGSAPAARAATNCPNCGAKLVAGARYCHSCGTPT